MLSIVRGLALRLLARLSLGHDNQIIADLLALRTKSRIVYARVTLTVGNRYHFLLIVLVFDLCLRAIYLASLREIGV